MIERRVSGEADGYARLNQLAGRYRNRSGNRRRSTGDRGGSERGLGVVSSCVQDAGLISRSTAKGYDSADRAYVARLGGSRCPRQSESECTKGFGDGEPG